MKVKIAIYLNLFLVALASIFVTTNTMVAHQPQPPEELLK
jgi:cyclic lactone autoinducer peptide